MYKSFTAGCANWYGFSMQKKESNRGQKDTFLTIQVFKDHLNPRTFRVPANWFTRVSVLAWGLVILTLLSSLYAAKEYFSERSARPALVSELETEVQQLKIALEKKAEAPAANVSSTPVTNIQPNVKNDPNAVDEKPTPGPGATLEGKDGTWAGLAAGIAPPSGESPVKLEDARLDWQGKFANFSAGVLYREPGKGSQQGHIVVLARGATQVSAHPTGVLNTASGDALMNPDRGEYFSVSRFRPLKTHLGPFETPSQLNEVQVFIFDLNHKLLLLQTFKYDKK